MRGLADSLITPQGFIRRGSVYYRYYGGCMLQCIGFGFDADMLRKTVAFALLPLGAVYAESAFTPRGCPFQYKLSCLDSDAVLSARLPEDELSALPTSVFPVMNETDSAEKLFAKLCELDCKKHGRPDMLDMLKVYASLQSGDFQRARDITKGIIENRREAMRRYQQSTAESEAKQKKQLELDESELRPCEKVLEAIASGDDAVRALLCENFEANAKYIKKHLHIDLAVDTEDAKGTRKR